MINNGYVMVTYHNFNKLSEKHIINLGYRLKYGTIWCRCLTNNYNKDYALQFEADSLVDFARKHPDMDVECLHIKLSLFDFKGHKIERDIRQDLFELQQQFKQKDVKSTTDYKLKSLTTEFSEPLFTKLAIEAKAIEMMASQVTTIKENCPCILKNIQRRLTLLITIMNVSKNSLNCWKFSVKSVKTMN